jgi:hypothetical protein
MNQPPKTKRIDALLGGRLHLRKAILRELGRPVTPTEMITINALTDVSTMYHTLLTLTDKGERSILGRGLGGLSKCSKERLRLLDQISSLMSRLESMKIPILPAADVDPRDNVRRLLAKIEAQQPVGATIASTDDVRGQDDGDLVAAPTADGTAGDLERT